MPLRNQHITAAQFLYTNNHYSIQVILAAVPSGLTVTRAWWTIKASPTDPDSSLIQKNITTNPATGVGQITANGSSNQRAILQFDFTPTDLNLLTANRSYSVDCKLQYSDNTVHPVIEDSDMTPGMGITQAVA